jgi:hypothetical protein
MTSIDDGERTSAWCFTEEEKDYGKKKNIDLIHYGGILILRGKRRHRSRASTASGRSGGFGLATELLPGKRMTTTSSCYFEAVRGRLVPDGLLSWAGLVGLWSR